MSTCGAPARITIALAVGVCLVTINLGIAQDVKLHPLADYEASLRAYHTARVRTQCIEFAAITKKKWWYYLPQLGFNFGLPTVNGGTNTFVQLDVTRQQNRVKLASIISQGTLDYRTELHQLRTLYHALQLEREAITDSYVTQKIENNIFEVASEANAKKDIKPVDFYQAQLLFQKQILSHEADRRAYALKVIDLARFARHQFPAQETLPGLDSLQLRQPGSEPRLSRQ